jgi:acetyl-CoA acetyltransferase family protein
MSDCIIAGGAESMSRGPYVISKAQTSYDREQKMWDSSFGWRFPNPRMKEMFPLLGMGETAEEIAKKYPQITRLEQDQFALDSHRKASAAYDKNLFERELTSVSIVEKKSTTVVSKDECVRSDSTLEALAKLKPAFTKDGSVTAGNSSPMNDGAAAVCLVSGDFLKRHQLTPLLKITAGVARGIHPNVMGLGPVAAINQLCQRHKFKVSDFDVVELNEAFAIQALACMQDLKIDGSKVNKRGGAIALGHPLGCSGARLMTTLASIMQDDAKLKKGLLSMCIGVGQGLAVSVENCR